MKAPQTQRWGGAVLAVLLLASVAAGTPEPTLGARQLDSLAAFARLVSLVRFFHPSDAVAAADWNRVAVAGVQTIGNTGNPQELAEALERFFRPLAPTLRVTPYGQRSPTPSELRPPADGRPVRTVVWRHYGGGFDAESKIFTSERIDNRTPPGFGTLAQAIVAAPFQGKRVRLRAWVRAEIAEGGRAQLGLRVDRPGGQIGFFDNMADRPIRDPAWRMYEIEGDVAADAERILVLLVVTGGGKAWLDEVSLTPVTGAAGAALLNTGFEEGETGAQPPGWLFPYESIRAGYHLSLRRGEACRWGGCAEVASDAIAVPRFGRPEEVLEVDLGAGVTAALPVSLYADEQGTLPHTPLPSWASIDAEADSREARLAAVALAWGLLQQLHPEPPPDDAWSAALRPALAAAAEPDREAFLDAQRRLLALLRDARAGFLWKSQPEPRSLPLAWEWIEGRLVITGLAEGAPDAAVLRPGDVVEAVDGRPVDKVVTAEEGRVSAATPEARRWQALENLLWGPAGSRVRLQLQDRGDVSLARDTPLDRKPAGTPLPSVAEPRPGYVYADLGRLEEKDLETLLPRLVQARGLLFDLRRGAGVSTVLLSYLLDRTAASSSWQVPVVLAPDRRDREWMTTFWTIQPKTPLLRAPVAFLVDGRTVGYGETLLGMIEEYRLGAIVGARSGGSNGSINRSDLPGGYRLRWTGQRVLKHDGSPLRGVGVAPTVPAARTREGIAAGRDEIVDAALEALLFQKRSQS